MNKKVSFNISPAFCLLLSIMLLTLPLKWLFAAIIAAAYHEMCHIAAIRLCSADIHRLDISADGAKLNISSLSTAQELICTLAGPIGGLCLLPFARWIPRIAVCATFQSLYNLLPIYPLDGGRALWCGLVMIMDQRQAQRFSKVIEIICLSAIILTAIYGAVTLKLGLSAFFPAILIFMHTKFGKIPCKQWLQRLQ